MSRAKLGISTLELGISTLELGISTLELGISRSERQNPYLYRFKKRMSQTDHCRDVALQRLYQRICCND
jgi:hypothetical protein